MSERVTVVIDDMILLSVVGSAAELREKYRRELEEDGMYDASDEEVVRHCYEQNPDLPELELIQP